MNMPAGQNRSNCAFRDGFLRLATMPTAQSGLKLQYSFNTTNRIERTQGNTALMTEVINIAETGFESLNPTLTEIQQHAKKVPL